MLTSRLTEGPIAVWFLFSKDLCAQKHYQNPWGAEKPEKRNFRGIWKKCLDRPDLLYISLCFLYINCVYIYLTKENVWPRAPSSIRARGAVTQWETWVTVEEFSFHCMAIRPGAPAIWAWAVGSRKGSRSPAAFSVGVIRATFSFYRFSAKNLLPCSVPGWE